MYDNGGLHITWKSLLHYLVKVWRFTNASNQMEI